MSIESCMHATDLDLDGSWLRESLMSLDEGSPHETPSVDEGIIASMREALMSTQAWMRESLMIMQVQTEDTCFRKE